MDGNTLQQKIYMGYAKSAEVIGQQFAQYRPPGPLVGDVIPANFVQYITAAFDNKPNWGFVTAPDYGKPIWYPLVDGNQVAIGDVLVGHPYTFVIADMPPIDPIVAFLANSTITIKRPTSNLGTGEQSYGGDYAPAETLIMLDCKASLLQGTKGEKGETNLPGDVRMPWFNVLLAAYKDITINPADVFYDHLGRRFKISSAELSVRGWRLTATQAQT